MRLFIRNQSRILLMALLVTIGANVLFGCGKKDPSRDAAPQASGAGDNGSDSGSSDSDDDTPIAPQVFDQLKDMWVLQVDGVAAQTDTLKKLAAQYPDAELSAIVAQLESKVADMKKALATATTPANGSKILKVEIPKLMEDTAPLANSANDRLQIVIKAATTKGT